MQALVRAFPPGADHPELALVRAMGDLAQGRLDEAAAHLAVAETYAETTPLGRRRRLRVAIASLKLSLARRRGHLVGVIEQARIPGIPGNWPVRRRHRLGQRPASGGADESRDRRGVVPGAARCRTPPPEAVSVQIAGELSVSLNTVSTPLRNIYAKLQVGDRSSAVRRARELGLLAARHPR